MLGHAHGSLDEEFAEAIAMLPKSKGGVGIQCPTCGATPPETLLGGVRWKWLALHLLLEGHG